MLSSRESLRLVLKDWGETSWLGSEIFSGNDKYVEQANGWIHARLGFSQVGTVPTVPGVGREFRVRMMKEGHEETARESAEARGGEVLGGE